MGLVKHNAVRATIDFHIAIGAEISAEWDGYLVENVFLNDSATPVPA